MGDRTCRRHPQRIADRAYDRDYAVLAGFDPTASIMAEDGPMPLEWLGTGDRVLTRDGGYQPVLWLERTRMNRRLQAALPELAPVCLRRGTLAPNGPDSDMIVSPSQLVFMPRNLSVPEGQGVLVPACELGVPSTQGTHSRPKPVTYVSILLPAHHLIRVNGVWMGSLFVADMAADLVPTDPLRAALDAEVMEPIAPIISRLDAARFLAAQKRRGRRSA